jgi:DNA anti-recombination protein RmuC
MNKKQKEEQFDLFTEAFHEVVVPELQEIKEDIKDIKERVGLVETSLEKIGDRLDRHGKSIEDLENSKLAATC